MKQYPRFDAEHYAQIPQIEFTMTFVKISAIYEKCKERLLYEQEALWGIDEQDYRAEDADAYVLNPKDFAGMTIIAGYIGKN